MATIYSNGGNRWNILGFNFTKGDALSSVYNISMDPPLKTVRYPGAISRLADGGRSVRMLVFLFRFFALHFNKVFKNKARRNI
jgi:hypothetical protein